MTHFTIFRLDRIRLYSSIATWCIFWSLIDESYALVLSRCSRTKSLCVTTLFSICSTMKCQQMLFLSLLSQPLLLLMCLFMLRSTEVNGSVDPYHSNANQLSLVLKSSPVRDEIAKFKRNTVLMAKGRAHQIT